MRLRPLLAIVLALQLPASAQEARRAGGEKLHPHMTRLLAERGPMKGWVFFADKALADEDVRSIALAEARERLTPRALERRRERRVLPGLVDERDAAVAPAYVDAVLATGVELAVESRWLNAVSVRGTKEQFDAIAELPFVDRIEPVRRGRLTDEARVAPQPATTGGTQSSVAGLFYGISEDQLAQVGLIDLHARGFTGGGVLVGILDTGFHRDHEAFNQSGHVVDVVAEHDFINNDGDTDIQGGDDPSQHSHGTYILGVIGAYLPTELVGGAYDASFILCKTEDITDEYQQEEDFYVAGLEFIESNGGDMATSSLGYIDWYTQSDLDGLTAVTTLGVNAATANGMVCCTAAGNAGHDANPATSALIAPADALEVITVGAVDFSEAMAGFSSDGPSADGRVKPEMLARGVDTKTVCAFTDVNCTTGVNGTSLSTPVMACVVACLLDAHPDFTVGQMRARLFRTGDYFVVNDEPDPQFVRGYGIPNADAAGFDCNANLVDDDDDITLNNEEDCNGNGLPDSCDIADGISQDADFNGKPDECIGGGKRTRHGPAQGAGGVIIPMTVLPPGPRFGGQVRLALDLETTSGTNALVVVRENGKLVGTALLPFVLEPGAPPRVELPLPDHASLAGRTLELRVAFFDARERLAWSETRSVTIGR